MKVLLVLVFAGLTSSFSPHPLHLTVSEAHYRKDKKTIEVSVKLFFDDFERALSSKEENAIYLCPDSANKHYYTVDQYFKENYSLKINNQLEEFELLGYECEKELVYVYLEFIDIKKVNSVSIDNKLLFDIFLDQTNLMHFHAYGESNTLLTQPKSPRNSIELK